MNRVLIIGSLICVVVLSKAFCSLRGIWYGGDTVNYLSGQWIPVNGSWRDDEFIDGKVQNGAVLVLGLTEKYSPPGHFALSPGINDTLQIYFSLQNDSDSDYDYSGKAPEQWFKIQIFDLSSSGPNALPYLDSSQVKYRFRKIGGIGSLTNKVHAKESDVALVYDIWDLPVGQWQVVVQPSVNIPSNVEGESFGRVFVNFPAHNLMDSIAAYEGNFWRIWADGDTAKAQQWIDSIFKYNENSFVGWGLTLELAYSNRDSAGIVEACTNAIKVLEDDKDPTVPHSDKLGAPENYTIERAWYEHYLEGLRSIYAGWTN